MCVSITKRCNYGAFVWCTDISMVPCQKGPTRHAYAWQIGPFSQDTIDLWDRFILRTYCIKVSRIIRKVDFSSFIYFDIIVVIPTMKFMSMKPIYDPYLFWVAFLHERINFKLALLWYHGQGSLWVWAQPMRRPYTVTLSLIGWASPRMIPWYALLQDQNMSESNIFSTFR